MSAVITDFFKVKESGEAERNRKRKHPADEENATETKGEMSEASKQPAKKRQKLTESKERKEESDPEDGEDDEDEDLEEDEAIQTKPNIDITYANCDELLNESWTKVLSAEFKQGYFVALRNKLEKEQQNGAEIFPPLHMVFRAFDLCEWNDLKAVILGQDPYHDDNQAEGLCFSVPKGVKIPSSLRNMMKEASGDIGFEKPNHGSLIQWAKQGVLLLNTVLTVQAHKANSHKKFGWQTFTDAVITNISKKHDGVVFILWGKQAQNKKKLINMSKHKIIESAHPSGLSAHRGFFGSKPFSKCNAYLKELGKEPINWQIDSC